MVFNICVKFHENMSSSFKVMEQTQKLLPQREREREREKKEREREKMKTIYPHGILRMLGV